MTKLKEKYGLVTAMSVVFGIVVGSGIFFKADDVLAKTGGSIPKAILAWTLGAIAMIFGALVFGEYAQRIKKTNGVVDYFEVAYGELPAYLVGWFKWILYVSPLSAILGWVSANYTVILFDGVTSFKPNVWIIAIIYIVLFYAINYYSAILAGKLQVTTTFIKLVPIILVGIAGLFAGIKSGVLADSISMATAQAVEGKSNLFGAVVATAFAYEGWILATSINSEIKDSKRNLPRALTYGTIAVFIAYVLYFMGIASTLPVETILKEGDSSVYTVVNHLFGNAAGALLTVFVVISCLGTLNGLIMSNIREPYSIAIRGRGIAPQYLSKVSEKTQMPTYAAGASLGLTLFYLLLWYFSLNETFGMFISLDQIPIVSMYVVYLALYVWYIFNFKDLSFVKRFVFPVLAIFGASVILYGGITDPSIGIYLLITVVITLLGLIFYKKDKVKNK